jgi:uncharacterized protein YbjT (DUF2867 family)
MDGPVSFSGAKQHVLVVGGTGRTGRRLVERLVADGRFEVSVVVRDHEKAQLVFDPDLDINVFEGDLRDVASWENRLDGVNQIVTAVSCGQCTDPLVALGLKPMPENVPHATDAEGIGALAAAAKAHGVRRLIAVTSASAGSPWSAAAIFLNAYHYGSIKHKWEGEQAIRKSGLAYIILRPYGLGPDVPVAGEDGAPRGVGWSQSETVSSDRRRIPRDDVAHLCHEALLLKMDDAPPSRATFECWAAKEHTRPMQWDMLKPDPPGPLADRDHDTPVALALGGTAIGSAALLRGGWRAARGVLRALSRR